MPDTNKTTIKREPKRDFTAKTVRNDTALREKFKTQVETLKHFKHRLKKFLSFDR